MTKSHWASMVLSLLAFGLFVVNVFFEMAYQIALDLRGPYGALILTGFLSIGLLIQVSKFLEGHRSRLDILITLILLPLHMAAEITIWVRTQIMHIGLPPELPFWMVGVYWMIGMVDVLAPRLGPELSKLRSSSLTPEQEVVVLKQENALLLQRLSITQEVQEQKRADESKIYTETCNICGEVFEKPTRDAAKNAVKGHKNRRHSGQIVAPIEMPALPPEVVARPSDIGDIPSEGF